MGKKITPCAVVVQGVLLCYASFVGCISHACQQLKHTTFCGDPEHNFGFSFGGHHHGAALSLSMSANCSFVIALTASPLFTIPAHPLP